MKAALRIGEAAQLLGITQKTIRHYHKIGLLAEPERSEGGYRLYTASDRTRLLRIRRLQALGLSLKQIKAILGAPDQERPLREVLQALLADLAAQIATLERRRAQIQALLAEDALAAIDAPAQPPALLQWAQAHLGDRLPPVSADVWAQDTRMLGLVEAFQWPASAEEQMKAALLLLGQHPEAMQQWAALAEQLVALAGVSEDSPEVERLVERVAQSGALSIFQSAASLSVSMPAGPMGEVMGDLLLGTLSPAQRRFIERMQQYIKSSEDQP
jgi:DNA-binding transcriptional MerR regulator